ncbi:hypothetical protein SAMD00079811_67020 [Scytonema sp. HK-05]|uniref:DUF72 domain-containing protein n=1 Tax=Scytonema sp. HK-05 TaxID=1137095 RepID=UPI0009370DBE|nr:DUF72 domain-containing protein [Scytonema sp. HK-05]OKH57852.1 hypothetical protein NIES2130_17715 [Scytonema sp. HK-05]BAY49073.1 hypothetical protein SAMD00079811_67020 [Scytonema sp. HK-05]
MGKLQIGTSGWVYKHWMGIFYPSHLPSDQQLSFYAQHFSTVEINFSFYRLPERSVFESWREQTPSGFLFAVKGSRYLTHMKKLKDPQEPLSRLMERVEGLQEKLGPILFQFPHTWHLNLERLQPFLELLQTYPQQRFTFEFRHSSWLIPQVYKLLENAGAALCLPVSPTVPLDVRLTAPWTYIRMHTGQYGVGYSDEELSIWANRIRLFLQQEADVYIYFNNDPDGHAIHDAQQLCKLLGY